MWAAQHVAGRDLRAEQTCSDLLFKDVLLIRSRLYLHLLAPPAACVQELSGAGVFQRA